MKRLLEGSRVAFLGTLGGVTKRDARRLVKDAGGIPCQLDDPELTLVVVGADEVPVSDPQDRLSTPLRQRVQDGELEVIEETQFWQRLGWVDADQHVRRLYTPAMLAQLLDVSVSTIRAWHRQGLIVPVREVHKLPYFDFAEVTAARHLAQLKTAGASSRKIQATLSQLTQRHPQAQRPLAELAVIVDGQQILVRRGSELVEPCGQMRIDFDALEQETPEPAAPRTLDLSQFRLDKLSQPEATQQSATADELTSIAAQLEEQGELEAAIEAYRSYLVGYGASAEVCFLLAELLYRTGDLAAARERYYMAIELNEHYVEARANLGCVLVELGDWELAVAAFRGTLRYHADYPDVHFHLAQTLDRMGEDRQAEQHWRTFLSLAPESPWADQARLRLESAAQERREAGE